MPMARYGPSRTFRVIVITFTRRSLYRITGKDKVFHVSVPVDKVFIRPELFEILDAGSRAVAFHMRAKGNARVKVQAFRNDDLLYW